MAEPRALDEPLSDGELDALETFLASESVPQDCMDLEMLDGFLTAIVSGPDVVQPSEWLPQVWSEGGRSATPAFSDSEQAQQIMSLVLRHFVGIQRTLGESPTRFRPLLYMPDESARKSDRAPPEGTAWCEGYMAGVKLRDDDWQPLYDATEARDWIFPIEALAFGDRDDDFTEWVDSDEKRASLIDELPVAAVLIYRFWQQRRAAKPAAGASARRGALPDATRKSRQRLH
ncbi:MAG: YecA family protein [Pseudomonadota bacterium]|nr:YecA family protein [Pseudomonadota bacterium]